MPKEVGTTDTRQQYIIQYINPFSSLCNVSECVIYIVCNLALAIAKSQESTFL